MAAIVAAVMMWPRRRRSSVRCRWVGSVRSAIAAVARSSAIAMITIAMPASSASEALEYRPLVTTSPRPCPPIRPAITTSESANMIV